MKYAVCAGSNYPGTDYQLAGCVNDANDWAALLEAEGYVVTLLAEPTLAELTGAVSAAVDQAGHGDRVVLTYSGHGTWAPDVDGDEADGRDEALVMGDLELLMDDALQRLFEPLHTSAGGLILADTCHSGTMSRLFGTGRPPVVDGAVARFVPPTVFARNLPEQRAIELEERAASTPRRTVSLISGAADSEYAYDAWFGTRANGAFTRAAVDCCETGLSLAAWYRRIRAALPSSD